MAFKFLTFHACFRECVIVITPLKCQMENVQEQHTAVTKPISPICGT